MSIELVMPFSHLILCRPLLLLPPIPHSIRVFSYQSTLRMRWPKYWSFSFSIIPSKEIPGLISFIFIFFHSWLPWWLRWQRIHLQCRRPSFKPWVGKFPWRMKWQPTPVFLPGQAHGQRSLAGYSSWGHKQLEMTEQLTHTSQFLLS